MMLGWRRSRCNKVASSTSPVVCQPPRRQKVTGVSRQQAPPYLVMLWTRLANTSGRVAVSGREWEGGGCARCRDNPGGTNHLYTFSYETSKFAFWRRVPLLYMGDVSPCTVVCMWRILWAIENIEIMDTEYVNLVLSTVTECMARVALQSANFHTFQSRGLVETCKLFGCWSGLKAN